jgi:hypothetical protein
MLDTPIVASPEDPTSMDENGADRGPALRETLPGFLQCRVENSSIKKPCLGSLASWRSPAARSAGRWIALLGSPKRGVWHRYASL